MKRDMDLIRTIMLDLERMAEPELSISEMEINGFEADIVLAHLELIEEAGFIEMNVERYGGGAPPQFFIHRITWAGHEFLETVRNETVWAKSTKFITSAGIGLALPLLQAVIRAKAAEHLGIPL